MSTDLQVLLVVGAFSLFLLILVSLSVVVQLAEKASPRLRRFLDDRFGPGTNGHRARNGDAGNRGHAE